MCVSENLIWCGTEGGVIAFDPVFETFLTWDKDDGLLSNSVTAINCDSQGRIWIGFENGSLQYYDQETMQWTLIRDFENHHIHCLTFLNDSLYVGLDIGISLYLVSRSEVKETYHRLGIGFQVEIPVHEILIHDKIIYAATEEGIAQSRTDYTNLQDPEKWTNFTTSEGLPENNVTSLATLNNRIFAGTTNGIGEWNGVSWITIQPSHTVDLAVSENHLFAATESGVYKFEGTSWNPVGHGLNNTRKIQYAFSSVWCGLNNGIAQYRDTGTDWSFFVPNCIGGNLISNLAIDAEGILWCCTRDNGFQVMMVTTGQCTIEKTYPVCDTMIL